MRSELEDSLRDKLKVADPVLAWLPQNVAWCYNRLQPTKAGKKTPYGRLTLKTYDHPVAMFGENILMRVIPTGKAQPLDWEKPCERRAHDPDGGERTSPRPGCATTCTWRGLGPAGPEDLVGDELDTLGAGCLAPPV